MHRSEKNTVAWLNSGGSPLAEINTERILIILERS